MRVTLNGRTVAHHNDLTVTECRMCGRSAVARFSHETDGRTFDHVWCSWCAFGETVLAVSCSACEEEQAWGLVADHEGHVTRLLADA